MRNFITSGLIFVGLLLVTFLGITFGLGKIFPSVDILNNRGQFDVGTTTNTPTSSPANMVNKKVSTPIALSQRSPTKINTTTKVTTLVQGVSPRPKTTVSTPGPLITTSTATYTVATSTHDIVPDQTGALNQKDIIMLTNVERTKEGLGTLVFSKRLAAMAETKANDMIIKQYFAHVSPNGTDVTKLAANVQYQYLNLGENLALGDFRSSEEVVTGWMNSPGHRANILNKNFTEIGVSAVMGNYEGRMVWYSVQEFGRPMPDCTKPDVVLEQKIALYETQVSATETTLAHLRTEIDDPNIDRETYATKVNDYNTLVNFYNGLVANVKADVATYNVGVNAYNACIGAGTN